VVYISLFPVFLVWHLDYDDHLEGAVRNLQYLIIHFKLLEA